MTRKEAIKFAENAVNLTDIPDVKEFYRMSAAALRLITREQVKMRGEWKIIEYEFFTCSRCGDSYYSGAESTAQAKSYLNSGHTYDFCPHCGAPMTDEAVDILWKRLEAMQDGAKTG